MIQPLHMLCNAHHKKCGYFLLYTKILRTIDYIFYALLFIPITIFKTENCTS